MELFGPNLSFVKKNRKWSSGPYLAWAYCLHPPLGRNTQQATCCSCNSPNGPAGEQLRQVRPGPWHN
jgi:hypothetical protein